MGNRVGCIGTALAVLVFCGCDTGTTPQAVSAPSNAPAPPVPDLPDDHTGTWTMTLDISDRCEIPDEARHRTYTSVWDGRRPVSEEGSNYYVTLKDATFRQGCGTNGLAPNLGCNQFVAYAEGDRIRFWLHDFEWGWGGHIVEQVSGGAWMGIGYGNFLVYRDGPTIAGSGKAEVFYCFDSSSGCTPAYCDGQFTDVQVRFTKQ
jgi:hypothetical protein